MNTTKLECNPECYMKEEKEKEREKEERRKSRMK